MQNMTINELRGMVAEGCQGHAEANAALAELCKRAASAPDLLAELMEVCNVMENVNAGMKLRPVDIRAVANQARAAIARAEGRG